MQIPLSFKTCYSFWYLYLLMFFGYILCTEILFLNTMNNRLQDKIKITSWFWIRMSILKWMNPSTIWYSLSYKSFFIHIFGSLFRALVSTSESNSSISFHQKMSPGKTDIWTICRGDNGNVFINCRVFPGSEWAFGAWMCPTVSLIGLPSVRAGQYAYRWKKWHQVFIVCLLNSSLIDESTHSERM